MPFIKKTLEKILGEERTERFVNTQSYKFCLETFTMNTFSYVVTAPIELIIAGMDFSEHIKIRAAAAVTNVLVGRPYGIWRDYIFGKFNITKKSRFAKKYIGDTLAFGAFLPVGWLNMVIGGAELDEMIRYSVTIMGIIGLLGRPYGVYLDFMRTQSGVPLGYSTSASHISGTEDKNKQI